MELRLLRLTVHFFSATVKRNRYSQLQLTEILRINFNHFEKLIGKFLVLKHLYSLAFTFGVKQQSNFVFLCNGRKTRHMKSKILTHSKLHTENGRNLFG